MEFIQDILENPALLVTVILTIGVILVNGWTDAPNAIATCISTRAIKPKNAIIMAAVFNFLGVFVMTLINKSVAMTISNMVDFGTDVRASSIALSGALASIVIWATAAWYFGIPTSESHALIAGLTGAAVAYFNSFKGVNPAEWMKVIFGLLLSTFGGFFLGWGLSKLIVLIFKDKDRRRTNKTFRNAQIGGAAAMAFMHGAQDGQKFIAVFIIGMALANGQAVSGSVDIPVWLMLFCSLLMALGTSIGGYRIIKAVGMDMVKLEAYQGFSADLAAALSLLAASLFKGLPVSTTHTKTTAIMGVGAAKRIRSVNWGVVREMVLAWVLTFPGCGLLGYLVTRLLIRLFV
ncbi:MAG: inorganic phosphate transporter [Anaerolineaceae bacterium]|nr:inorganic phosphate transporter [Anaerolineaceae bacterium]MDI9532004.1 inorganic phosphate transporter [Chloroflexota bacterium]HOF28483.1 inorganic phosphate transporter [Anaerolineaceae bacterium]HOU00824.1 inorganic phosphate transporter [Anaerolineaceae bacterium]